MQANPTPFSTLPVLSCLLCVLLSPLPWPPLLKAAFAGAGLMVQCYWVGRKPALFLPGASFLLGLLQDILGGGGIGLWLLAFLIGDMAFRSQQNPAPQTQFHTAPLPFMPRFTTRFAFVMLVGQGLQWAGASAAARLLLPPLPALLNALLGACLFPAVAMVLARVERACWEED